VFDVRQGALPRQRTVPAMIELRFEVVDEAAFEAEAPECESPVTVEYGMFECRIYFRVNGVDMLPRQGSMPLVGFGPRALQRLRLLQAGAADQMSIDDSGWLYFREQDGSVKIWTSSCPQGMLVPHAEALAAFERFVRETRDFLLARVPAMARHPQWRYWFPD
jgi:hypothetical protein